MQRDIGLYLDDILESIEKIEEYTHDLSEEEFSRNTQTQDAVLRRLTIIGEAVKHLLEDLKEKHKQFLGNKLQVQGTYLSTSILE